MSIEYVPARGWHAFAIVPRLRTIDRREWEAMRSRGSVEESLAYAIHEASWAITVLKDSTPICIFGVSALGRVGVPWMLGTDEMERHATALVRMGRQFVEQMHREFPLLVNGVHAENNTAIRWLRALGFTVRSDIAAPAGHFADPYHLFTKIASNV